MSKLQLDRRRRRPKIPTSSAKRRRIFWLIDYTRKQRGFRTEDKLATVLQQFQQVNFLVFQRSECGSPEDHWWDFKISLFCHPLNTKVKLSKPEVIPIQVKSGLVGVRKFWRKIIIGEETWVPVLWIAPEATHQQIEQAVWLLLREVFKRRWCKHKVYPPIVRVNEGGVGLVKLKNYTTTF